MFERDTMKWLETLTIRCKDKREVMDLLQKIGMPERGSRASRH
jgi:hypothetical protein